MITKRGRSAEGRLLLLTTIFLWIGSVGVLVSPSIRIGLEAMSALRKAATLGVLGVSVVGVGFLLWLLSPGGTMWLGRAAEAIRRSLPPRGAALALWGLSLAVLPLAILGPGGRFVEGLLPRLGLFWALALVGAALSFSVRSGESLAGRLPVAGVLLGVVYQVATYLPGISSYPFTLGWSEASRYYYASLFLSRSIYGFFVPPSVLHPSRYLLQALPFLIPGSPIWVHRLWQVLLWIAASGGAAFLLARRLNIPHSGMRWLVVGWGALFLLQGPVYYHLLVCVMLVLWGVEPRHFWRSALVVLAASLWAGISRVNWIPVPGLLAATLYLLETPRATTPWWRYALVPLIWAVMGALAGFASQAAYVALSGNAVTDFGSSFFSQLLWYRLLPSKTYGLGILPAAILASLPLLLLSYRYAVRAPRPFDPIRSLGLVGIPGVLFLGGLVVSVKIGGGSNLHNLDAYFSELLVLSAYIYFDRVRPVLGLPASTLSPVWLNTVIAMMPMLFLLGTGAPIESHDPRQTAEALATIRTRVSQATISGQDVLFISERQLLTFGELPGVRLVPKYETVFLMEMAMSRNRPYLDAFHDDLRHQRFAMIVVRDLETTLQGRGHSFGEENDAWVQEVSLPVLCWYEPTTTIQSISLQLLTPRATPSPCD